MLIQLNIISRKVYLCKVFKNFGRRFTGGIPLKVPKIMQILIQHGIYPLPKKVYIPGKFYPEVTGTYNQPPMFITKMKQNPDIFNFHLSQFSSRLSSYKWDYTKDLIPQVFTNLRSLISSSSSWKNNYNLEQTLKILSPVKPFGHIFPMNQHFLAHTHPDRLIDIQHFSKYFSIDIDFKEYYAYGMTFQNLLEITIFCEAFRPFYERYITEYGKDNIYLKAHNPALIDLQDSLNHAFPWFQNNPDFFLTLTTNASKGTPKTIPLDVKNIFYPENRVPSFNGNISVSYNYDFFEATAKLESMLTTINTANLSFVEEKTIDTKYSKVILPKCIRLKALKGSKKFEEIQTIKESLVTKKYLMLCDPQIISIFPSMITEAPVIDENLFDMMPLEKELQIYKNISVDPQDYFPQNGAKDIHYMSKIELFLKQFPLEYRNQLLEGYDTWLNIVKLISQ